MGVGTDPCDDISADLITVVNLLMLMIMNDAAAAEIYLHQRALSGIRDLFG